MKFNNIHLTGILILIFSFLSASNLQIGIIEFEGNFIFPDEHLRSVIYSSPGDKFDQQTINSDIIRISELYEKSNIYNVKIFHPKLDTSDPQAIGITFQIEENPELVIDEIFYTGHSYLSTKVIREKIGSGKIDLTRLSSKLRDLVNIYGNRGFMFTEVRLDSISYSGSKYTAHVHITENKPSTTAAYRFKGNKITRESTLLRISHLTNADIITPELIDLAEQSLNSKSYLKNCLVIPLNETEILIQIEEHRMSMFSGILGYNNSEDKSDRITGFIDLQFNNLFGTDRNLALHWYKAVADRSLIEIQYHESGPVNFPVSGDFILAREDVDSTYIRNNFESEIYYYDLRNKYGIFLGLDQVFPGNRRPKTVEKTSFQKAGVFWNYYTLDNKVNPSRGMNVTVKYYNIFHKSDNDNKSKNAVEGSWEYYRKLSGRTVAALKINTKIIEYRNLTDFDFFYLGGLKTLRGFNEKEFYGFRTGWINAEFRYLLSPSSRVFTFIDYGYVENESYKYGKLFGIGAGLRIETRLGIVGLDYGLGYFRDKLKNPLRGIIHFGLEAGL